MIRVVGHRDVAPVEQHPRTRPVLQHQRPRVIRLGRRARGRPCLPEFRAVGRVAVVDDHSAAERHRLRKAQYVPSDGRDALVRVRSHPFRKH